MDDINEISHKLKGLVTHQPIAKTKDIKQTLFESCVLARYSSEKIDKTNPMACMKYIQKAMQYQYLRVIRKYPDEALKLIYDANCCPCGFVVQPSTQVCNQPDVCPWCYIRRRLVPAYKALTVESKPGMHELLCIPSLQGFYTGRKHPHYWFNAKVTVQIGLPTLSINFNTEKYFVFLLSVIPKKEDNKSKIIELYPSTVRYALVDYTPEKLLEYLAVSVIDYSLLYHPTKVEVFENNLSLLRYSNHRKLRINRERN